MTRSDSNARKGRGYLAFWLSPLLLLSILPAAPAQFTTGSTPRLDLGRDPIVPPEVVFGPPSPSSNQNQPNRIRLFRIQPGFLSEPLGLEQDDQKSLLPPEPDDGPDFLSLSIGNDNPLLDFRKPGDPGGVGFTRVNTQLQLFDTTRTACSVGLQAVTPGGAQFDGLPERMGPTVVTPALSVFHSIDDALALQAYVGKQLPIQNSGAQLVRRDFQYGMALQRPLSRKEDDLLLRNVYLSVGALGLYRTDRDARAPVAWEVLPGLHYRLADNWWISTGVSVPVGTTRSDNGQHWQLTCSMQF
jgi:hypothetical protein